ncbi:unnamed protein product, partial [Ectocarpus sp. 8 AP-2014]
VGLSFFQTKFILLPRSALCTTQHAALSALCVSPAVTVYETPRPSHRHINLREHQFGVPFLLQYARKETGADLQCVATPSTKKQPLPRNTKRQDGQSIPVIRGAATQAAMRSRAMVWSVA